MSAVRIGQVARRVNLVRTQFAQELHRAVDILWRDAAIPCRRFLVEGQVEEVEFVGSHAAHARGGACLGPAQRGFHLAGVTGSRRIARKRIAADLPAEVEIPVQHFIMHVVAARDLIRDTDIVALRREADERAAHRKHLVVRVRREDQNALGENRGGRTAQRARLRDWLSSRILRLAARPAGDRVLQLAESAEIDLVRVAVQGKQFLEAVAVVILVGQFEDGFARLRGEPRHRPALHGIRPVEAQFVQRPNQPRRLQPGKLHRRRRVEHHKAVVVVLQIRRGHLGADLALDRAGDDGGLVFAEGHDDDAPRLENGANAHGDRGARDEFLALEILECIEPRQAVEMDQARQAAFGGSRLIEADMAGATDAEDL